MSDGLNEIYLTLGKKNPKLQKKLLKFIHLPFKEITPKQKNANLIFKSF